MAYLENVEDLDELLIGQCYLPRNQSVTGKMANTTYNWSNICQFAKGYFLPVHLMDDDVAEYVYTPRPELTWARMKMSQIHYWQRDPWRDSEYKELIDNNFTDTYERIAVRKYFKHILASVGGRSFVCAKCGVVDGVPGSIAVYAVRHFSRDWRVPKQKNFAREF